MLYPCYILGERASKQIKCLNRENGFHNIDVLNIDTEKKRCQYPKMNQTTPIKRAPNVNATVQPDGSVSPAHGSADDDAMAERAPT